MNQKIELKQKEMHMNNENKVTGITPWNQEPPTSPSQKRVELRSVEIFTVCSHPSAEATPPRAKGTNDKPMQRLSAADIHKLRDLTKAIFDRQPHIWQRLAALRTQLDGGRFEYLIGLIGGIGNRLARGGYSVQQVPEEDLATAERFADEVVFTGPEVCLCRHEHAAELKRLWQRISTRATTEDPCRLFRLAYIFLEALEHNKRRAQGNVPHFYAANTRAGRKIKFTM